MPWLRCVLVNDEQEVEITLDVLVSNDKVVESGITFFGYWRNTDGTGNYPFAFDYEGKMDFGYSHSEVGTLNIRGKRIVEGLPVQYIGYENPSRLERNEIMDEFELLVTSYRDHSV